MSRSFKDKLSNFEVQPPAAAWDHISEQLATDHEALMISNKLFDYAVPPPTAAWGNIKSSIDKDAEVPSSTFIIKRTQQSFYKYAIAAATIGVIVLGFLYLNNTATVKNRLAISNGVNKKKGLTTPESFEAQAVPSTGEPDEEEVADPPIASNFKMDKNYVQNSKVLQNTTVKNSLFHGDELQIKIPARPIRNAKGEIIQDPEIINNPFSRYISITSPNGEQTKISSKFLHMLLFINDANDVDEVDGYFDKNFLESLIWKSRFRDWRNQIMNTSFVPSSTNFMDILDFKDLIMKDK